MNTTLSPAHPRVAGVTEHLHLALTQAAKVAISALALCGLLATVVASESGAISYRELCSLLALSAALMGFTFALFTGVRVMFTKERWQTFLNRFASAIASGIIIGLVVPTP